MKENIGLIDGKSYQFKLKGYVCNGIFLKDDNDDDGAFYCNGTSICNLSDATQIERLYSENDLSKKISAMVTESLVITDPDGNTVDFGWCEGVVELEDRITDKQQHLHIIEDLINEFDFDCHGNAKPQLVRKLKDWAIKKDKNQNEE